MKNNGIILDREEFLGISETLFFVASSSNNNTIRLILSRTDLLTKQLYYYYNNNSLSHARLTTTTRRIVKEPKNFMVTARSYDNIGRCILVENREGA